MIAIVAAHGGSVAALPDRGRAAGGTADYIMRWQLISSLYLSRWPSKVMSLWI